MSDVKNYRNRFLLAVEQAREVEETVASASIIRRLKRMFPEQRDLMDDAYVHPKALSLTKALTGDLPPTLIKAGKEGRLCVLRLKQSRDLWFLSCLNAAAKTSSTTLTIEGTGWHLWAASDTNPENFPT